MSTDDRTVRLHRVLKATPEKVFRAFVEPEALARWLPPNGFTCGIDKLEARAGGSFHMHFTNFTTGNSHAFGGDYLEFVPGEKLVYTDRFDSPQMPGEMHVTVTFKAVSGGCELNVTQKGIPEAIPLDMCYLGWQDSLKHLARLVEPEIPS